MRPQFRLAWIFVFMAVVSVALSYHDMRLNYLVWTMSNSNVVSDGGPNLRLTGAALRIVREYGVNARDLLKATLKDPQRFAAAHVALAEVTGVKTGASWHDGPGAFVSDRLSYRRDSQHRLQFDLQDNGHLSEWWIETVGEHLGIPIIDEETEQLGWLNEAERSN